MRPRPSEVVAGVRRILEEVVAPQVASEHARSRLREIRAVLAQFDWDDGVLAYASDTRRTADLVERLAAWARTDPARRDHFAEALADLPVTGSPDTGDADGERLHDLERRRGALDAWVVRVLDPLDRWLVANPEDGAAAALRHDIASHYLDPDDGGSHGA